MTRFWVVIFNILKLKKNALDHNIIKKNIEKILDKIIITTKEMEFIMFSVNFIGSMDHDPKRVTTEKRVTKRITIQKWITIFVVKDHDPKTGTEPEGSIFFTDPRGQIKRCHEPKTGLDHVWSFILYVLKFGLFTIQIFSNFSLIRTGAGIDFFCFLHQNMKI